MQSKKRSRSLPYLKPKSKLPIKFCSPRYYNFLFVRLQTTQDINWLKIEELVSTCNSQFGAVYEFAPLYRSEGGLMQIKGPGFVSTERADGQSTVSDKQGSWKNVRFNFLDWRVKEEAMKTDGDTCRLQFKSCNTEWSEYEQNLLSCCIIKVFSWKLLRSPNYKKIQRLLLPVVVVP